jgi:hypothetical protein
MLSGLIEKRTSSSACVRKTPLTDVGRAELDPLVNFRVTDIGCRGRLRKSRLGHLEMSLGREQDSRLSVGWG